MFRTSRWSFGYHVCVATIVASLWGSAALAEEWASATPGNWNDPLNWLPQSVPNGVGASAIILSTIEGGPLASPGTFTFDVPVTLGSFHANMGVGGPSLFFNGNTLTMDNGGGADVTMFADGTGPLNFTNDIVLMGPLVTEWRASNASITSSISGNFGITQDAVGGIPRLRLWGTNTYTGLTIARNGWISFQTVAGLGDNSSGTIVEAGGTLVMEALGSPTIIGEPVTIMDGGRLLLRQCDWAQDITMINDAKIAPWFDDFEVTISGQLTGNSTFTRLSAQSSSGNPLQESIVFLTNVNNDYTGDTIIDGGLLAVSDDAQLGAAGFDVVFTQTGFSEGSSALVTTTNVTINRNIVLNNDPGWLRADDGTTGTYTGVIASVGSQPLDIGFDVWTGIVELQGDNTYSGTTTVQAGTLRVSNTTGSGTGTGQVIVQSGATLSGDGIIGGDVTAQTGSTIGPGANTGSLDVDSVTFDTGSTYEVELAGDVDFDQLLVTNTATLDGTIDVSLIGGYMPADGAMFDVVIAATATGTFSVETLPGGFSVEYLADRVRLHFAGIICPADIADSGGPNPDGLVNVFDLLEVLANWGTGGNGAAIASPVGVVDVFDLLDLLSAWGSCA